jgi:GNAT superfamily N-acetyltransferase
LDTKAKTQLADALGDSPETGIPVHLLRQGRGLVHLVGDLPHFEAVIIEDYDVGPELLAFGRDIYGFLSILRDIAHWEAVNLPHTLGEPLSLLVCNELGLPNHLVDDIYQVPGGPVAAFHHPEVRMLTPADIPLLEVAPDDIRDSFDDDLNVVLEQERIAGAVLPDAGIVAIGATYGFCEPFVDVAISTLAEYRGRGYARAAASLVASAVQQAGRTPIWSCAPTNLPSLAVARALGFREVSRRINVVLDGQ